ncbi:MAG: hypothetical protein ACE5GO_10420, partial [Anaerolineales bacterium]
SLTAGVQSVTLSFDGDDIRAAQLNGPYTVTNLQVTEINAGIPSQIVDDAHTTPAYSWSGFGSSSPKVYLPIVQK